MTTRPSGSKVAVWSARALERAGAEVKVLPLYSSALASSVVPSKPPTSSTAPFGNRLEVWRVRAARSAPVALAPAVGR